MQLNSAPYAGLAKVGSLKQHHILFSKVAVTTIISECKPIDVPIGRRLLGNLSTIDSSAVLVCDVGFVPDTTLVTCKADGTWKPSLSACVIGIIVFYLNQRIRCA